MRKIIWLILGTLLVATTAFAEDVKVTADLTHIEKISDGYEVTLKSSSGEIQLYVKDELTVGKLADRRISLGDNIRVKYDSDSKVVKLFRKTAGC